MSRRREYYHAEKRSIRPREDAGCYVGLRRPRRGTAVRHLQRMSDAHERNRWPGVDDLYAPARGLRVVRRFMYEKSPDRAIISMTIDDCDHFSEEQKKQIIASYQPFELEAKVAAFPRWEAGAYSRLPPRALAATTARYRTTGLVLVEWISAGRITSQLAS